MLAAAGARPEHLVRLTWYVVDKREYLASLKALGAVYREVIGRHYPAMTAVEVGGADRGRGAGRDRGDGGDPGLNGDARAAVPQSARTPTAAAAAARAR